MYRSRALNRNISPQELAGLQAVLAVIRAVATHDDVARIALCEHPSWAPLHILLGLVSCSIDISLKTDLLLTLAALSKSKETALQLWVNLEASQIITTIPYNTELPSSIESEIDKTESRNETYPLTQAILELMYTLSSTIMPRNLGAGPRKSGIHPYFNFVLESIFLIFYNRYVYCNYLRLSNSNICMILVRSLPQNLQGRRGKMDCGRKVSEIVRLLCASI